MKQLFLLTVFAFVCSTFAGTNDSIGVTENLGKDTAVMKSNHQSMSTGDSLKLWKANFIDSMQKSHTHEKRKHNLIGGIIASVGATVTILLLYILLEYSRSHPVG
jgi:hypothetical protein